MTINDQGLIYNGTWECEGHIVSFEPKGDDITISESRQSIYKGSKNFSRTVPLEDGISQQAQLIKWGYRRIS